jgi:hypothetical protein
MIFVDPVTLSRLFSVNHIWPRVEIAILDAKAYFHSVCSPIRQTRHISRASANDKLLTILYVDKGGNTDLGFLNSSG